MQREPEQPGLAALVEPGLRTSSVPTASALPSETRSSRPVSRSPTSAVPSGRNAMPHGTASPVITSPATCGFGAADSVGVGVGVSVGVGVGVVASVVVLAVVLGAADGSGDPPDCSSPLHAASAASEAPAPPRSSTRLVVRTPMGRA